jgi:tetratricopeptide (TPR) repeat protein
VDRLSFVAKSIMRGKRAIVVAVLGLLVIGAAWWFQRQAQHALLQQLLVDSQAALAEGKLDEAETLARRIIAAGGPAAASRLLAGEAAVGQGASDRALAYLEPLLVGTDENAVIALGAAANIYWELGDLSQAERSLRRMLEISPEHDFATARLAYLLTLTGRHWESGPLRLSMMRRDSFDFDDLLLWGNARALIKTDELTRLRQLAPQDPLLKLGAASIAARSNDMPAARKLVAEVIAARPDLVEARALQGYLLLDQASATDEEMLDWNQGLPPGSDEHPDIWVIRGFWTKRHGSAAAAGRCFWEAVRRSPNHQTANYQLALVLGELNRADADWIRQRAESLEELQRMLGVLDTRCSARPGSSVWCPSDSPHSIARSS